MYQVTIMLLDGTCRISSLLLRGEALAHYGAGVAALHYTAASVVLRNNGVIVAQAR